MTATATPPGLALVDIEGLQLPIEAGPFTLNEDDFLFYGMCLDPVYMPELLWKDPKNHEYSGQYRVRDYQYIINRLEDPYAIISCARSVGKTESEKVHAEIHPLKNFDRLLITAPELIHLLPLTDQVESNIQDNRLLSEFLDLRNGQTGFQHRPFQCNFIDGTKIIGRIPKKDGTGVKAQHQKDLIVEEGQDFPERGWTEINETVNYDSRDRDGNPDFHFWVYGVHSGNKASGFDERARSSLFRKIKVTALRRPDWGKQRKQNAIAAYGGTSSPDYKRNILGEPGAGTTAYFVTARVMSCVDQNVSRGEKPGSDYNENVYVQQTLRIEELEDLGMSVTDVLDLPSRDLSRCWWGGTDVGLTDSPTVISLWAEIMHAKKPRLALIRRYTLERFRPKQIREALYAIGWHLGTNLQGVGIDVTGLGRPIFQDMEDDELCPPHLRNVTAGYTFNSKVEVGVDEGLITENQGVLRDHLGNMVKRVENEMTGEVKFVVMMPFIAASTRFIADDIDAGYWLLPFDTDVTSDMLQETKQRVERVGNRGETGGGAPKKGDRFHILDSFRAMAYRRRQDDILAALATGPQEDVLDLAGADVTQGWTQEQINGVLGIA